MAYSADLNTHPNQQFLGHFVDYTLSCWHVLRRVTRPPWGDGDTVTLGMPPPRGGGGVWRPLRAAGDFSMGTELHSPNSLCSHGFPVPPPVFVELGLLFPRGGDYNWS